MKTFASRAALGALALLLAAAPALARGHAAAPDPMASPTPAPLLEIASPPPTVNAANAADACANDVFLSYRTVPAPTDHEVTVCGLVTDQGVGMPPAGRGASRPAFWVGVDGSTPIAVLWGGATAHPGDIAVVRGTYHRENGGGESIDVAHTAARGKPADGFVMLNGTLSH